MERWLHAGGGRLKSTTSTTAPILGAVHPARTSTVGEECGRAVESAAAAHTASEAQSIQAILPTKSLIETRVRKSCAPSMLPAASARVGRRVPPNPKGTCFSGPGSRINLGFSRRHDPPGGSCRRPDAGHRRRRRGLRDVPFRHFVNLGKTQTKPRTPPRSNAAKIQRRVKSTEFA